MSYRIVRAVAFYISVGLYVVLLPIFISYSLGYKIDFKAFKIYKMGMIYIKSNPAGASISLNGRPYHDITPAKIENLKPGAYSVEVKREGFYPWQKELVVNPNMVTEADDIVLFPVMQEMGAVNGHKIINFVITDRGVIYYMAEDGLFRSNTDGTYFKKVSSYNDWPRVIKKKVISPDGEKIMYYDSKNVWVIYLLAGLNINKGVRNNETARVEEVFKNLSFIREAFWYPGFDYIVVITNREVQAAELRGGGPRNVATLYRFKTKPADVYYDKNNYSLYFTDRAPDGSGPYLYRLDLKEKIFDKLIKRLKKEFEIKDAE